MAKKNIHLTEQEQKIAELLYKELDYTYCHNCRFGTEIKEEDCTEESCMVWGCEDCHRKYMGWELSKAEAKTIAMKISKLVN